MGFTLFSKKQRDTKVPVDSGATIMKIKQNLDVQEKREAHLQNKMKTLETEAKSKMAKGDKRGALFAMKKRKMYDAELSKIENVKMTLETQAINLEGATQNIETMNAMKSGSSAMKWIRKSVGVDKVDGLMDDVRDEMELHRETDMVFSQPIDPCLADDDDLLAELEALEAEDTKTSVSMWPVSPSRPAKTEARPTAEKKSTRFALFA